MPSLELYVFRFSHYCEKVLWACDFKKLPVTIHYLLPGLHTKKIRSLSQQTAVPVLLLDGEPITGSARIIEKLEQYFPEPSLYPANSDLVKEVLAEQDAIDRLGPAIRGGLFRHLLKKPKSAASLWVGDGGVSKSLYPPFLGLAGSLLRKQVLKESSMIDQGLTETEQYLNRLQLIDNKPQYLIGEQFSIADLAAAAMLSPLCFPAEAGHSTPAALQEEMSPWFSRWQDSQAMDWVKMIYQKHR